MILYVCQTIKNKSTFEFSKLKYDWFRVKKMKMLLIFYQELNFDLISIL